MVGRWGPWSGKLRNFIYMSRTMNFGSMCHSGCFILTLFTWVGPSGLVRGMGATPFLSHYSHGYVKRKAATQFSSPYMRGYAYVLGGYGFMFLRQKRGKWKTRSISTTLSFMSFPYVAPCAESCCGLEQRARPALAVSPPGCHG